MTKHQQVILSKEDVRTIEKAFDEPLKIQLLFKILKIPNISSKELKNELFMSGTKIYYYLNQLSKENSQNHAIILATEHKDETREHLIMKTYILSPWMEELIKTEKIFNLYESEAKNKKWHLLTTQRITIALITHQLNEFKMKDESEIEKEIADLPVYNFALVTQKTSDSVSNEFKKAFDYLCSLEDQQKPLFERLVSSKYSIVLHSIKMD